VPKHMHWRNDSLFNKWYRKKWISTCRRLKLDPCLLPCTKIYLKWIKDLNVRPKALTYYGKTLEDLGRDNKFLNSTPIAQKIKAKIDKWDWIKPRSFCTTKETITGMKRQPTEWEKIFASYLSDKKPINRIYKDLKKKKT
jgi:hypothetical protein